MVDDWVTITSFRMLPEAEAAKLLLEAEGIPVFLADAETVNMDWLLGNAIGYIKLQVPEAIASRAAILLEEIESHKKPTIDDLVEGEAAVCLACGETMATDDTVCLKCGWSYAVDVDE